MANKPTARKASDHWNKVAIVLLAAMIALVPIIVHIKVVPVAAEEMSIIGSETYADVFSYYKSALVIFFGTSILLFAISKFFRDIDVKGIDRIKFFKSPITIAALLYLAFAIASSIASPYQHLVNFGATQRYESIWVLLAYMAIFLGAASFVRTKLNIKYIIYALYFSGFIVGIIGFFQFIDLDPFETLTAAKIVTGALYDGSPLQVNFDSVYSTLYNPNCVGLYGGMMVPLTLILSIYSPVKSQFKYVSMVLFVLMFICLIGSESRGGYVSLAVSTAFIVIVALIRAINQKKFKELAKYGALSIGFVVAASAIFLIVIGSDSRTTLANKIVSIFETENTPNYSFLQDINADENGIQIHTIKGITNVSLDVYIDGETDESTILSAVITGPSGDEATLVSSEYDENGVLVDMLDVPQIGSVELRTLQPYYVVSFSDSPGNPILMTTENGLLQVVNRNYEVVDINQEVPAIGFEGMEQYASSRGYIWSRTIPLLQDRIFIGSGPDTFSVVFPQDDLKGKIVAFGNPFMVVDKAHNLYMQTAVTTGVLSLVALLVIFVLYIVQTFILLIKTSAIKDSYVFMVAFAIFAGVIGYFTSSMATDSLVSVAPVFWTLIGTGFAINFVTLSAIKAEKARQSKEAA